MIKPLNKHSQGNCLKFPTLPQHLREMLSNTHMADRTHTQEKMQQLPSACVLRVSKLTNSSLFIFEIDCLLLIFLQVNINHLGYKNSNYGPYYIALECKT